MDAEISKQGILPMVAPVKPYTLLADTLSASWRPSSTAFVKGSVAAFRSAFALRTMHHTGFKAQGSGCGRQRRLRRILPPGPGSAPCGLQIYVGQNRNLRCNSFIDSILQSFIHISL